MLSFAIHGLPKKFDTIRRYYVEIINKMFWLIYCSLPVIRLRNHKLRRYALEQSAHISRPGI